MTQVSASRNVCVLTTAHLSNNPRAVKEADALAEAGYRVTVLAVQFDPHLEDSDAQIIDRGRWRCELLVWDRKRRPWLFWKSRLRKKVATVLLEILHPMIQGRFRMWLELRAFERVLPELLARARHCRADLYIGHNPGTLPLVVMLKTLTGAKAGFDAEDLHSGMVRRGETPNITDRIATEWEAAYLPELDHFTVSAPLIGKAYDRLYPVRVNAVVLNAFDPIKNRGASDKLDEQLSLYWVSQTIGASRGLEDLVRAMGRVVDPSVKLYLRGDWQPGFEAKLRSIARQSGVAQDAIVHLNRVPPMELTQSSSQFDIGIASELGMSKNSNLCVSNKILLYIASGLAVATSETQGQRDLFAGCVEVGFCYPPGDIDAIAAGIRRYANDRSALEKARGNARRLAERLNWTSEKQKLVRAVAECLDPLRVSMGDYRIGSAS